jgi:hypothetical protein
LKTKDGDEQGVDRPALPDLLAIRDARAAKPPSSPSP